MAFVRVTPTSAILFPSAEFVRERIMQSSEQNKDIFYQIVLVDCHRINKIDFTAAKVFL